MTGVPYPTDDETPGAAVVPDGCASPIAEEMVSHRRGRIAGHQRSRHVVSVDALARNAGGVVLQRRPREEYAHLGGPAGAP